MYPPFDLLPCFKVSRWTNSFPVVSHFIFDSSVITLHILSYRTQKLTDLSGKGSNEFDFHFFDHHKRTDKDEIEDRTLSLELWACSKSNTRKDPPLAFCLCDCDVTLSDVWNRGTKRFRCPMYVRPKWTLDRVRDILSDVNDSETLDGAWISVGDALRSVDLPLSLPSESESESESKRRNVVARAECHCCVRLCIEMIRVSRMMKSHYSHMVVSGMERF